MANQEDTLLDLPANLIIWTHYLTKGKECLAKNQITKAILHFTLADEAARKSPDITRQIESLNWLILSYHRSGNGNVINNFVSRLKGLLNKVKLQPEELKDDALLLSKAVIYEAEKSYRQAETTYAWLMANYRQQGLSPHAPEMAVIAARSEDLVKSNSDF